MLSTLALILVAAGAPAPLAMPIKATTVVTFKLMPPGAFGQITGTVGKARCYALNEYLRLAEFDAELVKLRLDIGGYQGIIDGLKKEIAAQSDTIKVMQDENSILSGRSSRCQKSFEECQIASLHTPIWPYVVGIVGSAVGLVGAGVYLGTR